MPEGEPTLDEQIAAVTEAIDDYGDPHPDDLWKIRALRAALRTLEGLRDG